MATSPYPVLDALASLNDLKELVTQVNEMRAELKGQNHSEFGAGIDSSEINTDAWTARMNHREEAQIHLSVAITRINSAITELSIIQDLYNLELAQEVSNAT